VPNTFPGGPAVEPGLARGSDWPAVRERLVVVSSGKLVPIVHGEEWQADVHEWSWFWFWGEPTGIVQSPLSRICKLQKRNAPLSRRDMGSCNISASCMPSAMYPIIPDRALAFPFLLFYLPTASKRDIDVAHVFDLLASDLESFPPLHSPLSLRLPCIITPFRGHEYYVYN